jgi:hypothetical protein
MEKSDGFQADPIHKTNNLLLRFLANQVSHKISNYFLTLSLKRYFKYEDDYDRDENFRMPSKDYFFHAIYAKLYYYLDIPYYKWGTTYTLDLERIRSWYAKEWEELQQDNIIKEKNE